MNVSVLKQFLHSLVGPMQATPNGQALAAQLEQACGCLEPFGNRDVGDFTEFLRRAQNYERDGHWPDFRPPIAGELIDQPGAAEYAARLKACFQRCGQSNAAISPATQADLTKLEKVLSLAEVRAIAHEIGVRDLSSTKKTAFAQVVDELTGQSVSAIAGKLRQVAGTPEALAALERLKADPKMGGPKLKGIALALHLEVPAKATKQVLLRQIGTFLTPKPVAKQPTPESPERDHVGQFAEIVQALKAKADLPGSPTEEIEAELRSLEQQLNKDDALELVRRLGIVRPVSTRQEAMEAIQRKVFEVKRAREAIAY